MEVLRFPAFSQRSAGPIALEDYEVNAGYVLTCQCYPLTDTLVVSYDQ